MTRKTARAPGAETALVLERFVPYRISVLAQLMSRELARVYADRFDMTIPEWRVMAVLGETPDLSANEICARTVQDKVTVSRAIQRLESMGRVRRRIDGQDRRRTRQRLTAAGMSVYRKIVPLAHGYEAEALAGLNERDRKALDRVVAKLTAHLKTLDMVD